MKTISRWLFTFVLMTFSITALQAAGPYTIAVVPKGTTHEFWKSINAGAFKARDELIAKGFKIDVIWKGPLREDDREPTPRDPAKQEPEALPP